MATKIKEEVQHEVDPLEINSHNNYGNFYVNIEESCKKEQHNFDLIKIEECILAEVKKEPEEELMNKEWEEVTLGKDLDTSQDYCCYNCDFHCFKKRSLINHMRIHKNRRPFDSKKENELANQVPLVSSTSDNIACDVITRRSNVKLHRCNICEYSSKKRPVLRKHMMKHTGEKPFECILCKYSSIQKESLKRHMMKHTGEVPYQCNMCEYKSIHKETYKRHMEIHTGVKPYQCNLCDFKCSVKDYLRKHTMVHTGERPHQCTTCEYRTVRKSSLKKHMKTHAGIKIYQCRACEFASQRKGTLMKHIMMHTGKKPYQCSLCEFNSVWKRSLNKHMTLHKKDQKPLQCNLIV